MTNERYSRQILFAPVGRAGQQRLRDSSVMLVGCGALGASHAEMLTRAGVGKLRIVDRDFVEFTNLQRQMLFTENDAAERIPKAVAAKERLRAINSDVDIEAVVADINNSNIETFIEGCDIVIDGTDNFQIRFLVNDACVKHEKTWIYGAVVSANGITMTIRPGVSPCLRCIFPEMPDAGSAPTCDTVGVIMPIISTISSIQVAEAFKLMVGDTAALHNSLIEIDLWKNEHRSIPLDEPDPDCPACGKRIFEFLDAERVEFSAVLCGRDAVQVAPNPPVTLDLEKLAERIGAVTPVKKNEYLVRFSADGMEMTVFADGRAIIRGTEDATAARSLYSRFIGD